MALRLLLAGLHLLALGIGLGAVVVRGLALRSRLDVAGLRRVFAADNLWGLAALLWISTGLWRLLGGVEKGSAYYLANHAFLTKMGLLGLILLLETRPMITLIRWRREVAAGRSPDTAPARGLAKISFWQGAIIVVMVFLAAAMARGFGA